MVYNPARANRNQKAKRAPNPHAGVKHSDIVRRNGVGLNAPMSVSKENTKHGMSAPIFEAPGFSVRYETVFAGNNTGIGVSEEGDRTIRVLRGSLFVFFEDENGVSIQYQIRADQHLNAPRGVRHGYATSGTEDVEILVVESADYKWTLTGESVVTSAPDAVIASPAASIPPRRTESPAKEQALELQRQRRRPAKNKVVSPQNANSANAAGVNLRPMGPAALEE